MPNWLSHRRIGPPARNGIVVVRDGVKALDYLLGRRGDGGQKPNDTPVLIVLDLHMPKIGGLALLRRLRAEERTRRIPVLILSGSSDERDVVSSHDLGANRFIGKPSNLRRLHGNWGYTGWLPR